MCIAGKGNTGKYINIKVALKIVRMCLHNMAMIIGASIQEVKEMGKLMENWEYIRWS